VRVGRDEEDRGVGDANAGRGKRAEEGGGKRAKGKREGYGNPGLGLRVEGAGFRVSGCGLRVEG
jgi:hypothetical protein